MFLRRLLLLSLAALALTGCVSFDGYEWFPVAAALTPVWMAVGQRGVLAFCPQHQNFHVNACAIRNPDACLIVAEKSESQTPAWLVAHEKRHCAGENHKAPTEFPQLTVR